VRPSSDLARYYLAVADGALRGVYERPTVLKRFPDGATGEPFFQKRVPEKRPEWLQTVRVTFPSGRSADELCPVDAAHLIWAVNLGCLDLNPWAVRRGYVDHPDELRVDLDPQPDVPYTAVRAVAATVQEVLHEQGLVGYPKTSGSRGIHVNVRIEPRRDFLEVRRAALALAREVERRMPSTATTKWWKEERGERVFISPSSGESPAGSSRASANAPDAAPRVCLRNPHHDGGIRAVVFSQVRLW
jgi:bifunctional non-homologous end joining protein LigD